MVIFLAEDVHDMCGKLIHKFVKKSILDSADIMYNIANLDVLDKKNHKTAAEIDVGFAAKDMLLNLVKTRQ